MTRSLGRLRQAVAESQDAYIDKLDHQWMETIPDEYRGHSVYEAIGGNGHKAGWNGSLSDSDIDKMADYIEDPSKFAILRGTAGTGKSTLAASLGRKLIHDRKISGAFVTSVQMMREFSFSMDDDPVQRYSALGVLVIDDLGAVNESMTAHRQQSLWSLIEARWSKRGLFTIITTNMAIQDNGQGLGLASWIGESGWDRIASDLTRINMSGESFR